MRIEVEQQHAVDGDGYVMERRHVDDARDIVDANPDERRLMSRQVLTMTGDWRSVDNAQDGLVVYALRARMLTGDWVPAGVYLSLDGAKAGAATLHALFGNLAPSPFVSSWRETDAYRDRDLHADYVRDDGRYAISRSAVRP